MCRNIGSSAGHTLPDRAVWPPRHYCWETQGLTAQEKDRQSPHTYTGTLYVPPFDDDSLGGWRHACFNSTSNRSAKDSREERRIQKGKVRLKGKGRKRRRKGRRRKRGGRHKVRRSMLNQQLTSQVRAGCTGGGVPCDVLVTEVLGQL